MTPSQQMTQALQGTSFDFTDSALLPRLVLSIVGPEGCGKTHLAHTAPRKRGILYMGTDIGREGVTERYAADCRRLGIPYGHAEYPLTIPNGAKPSEIMNLAQAVWAKEAQDFQAAVRARVSTIIMDTGSEFYQHLCLARFGKETEVPPPMWHIVGSEYSQLIRQVYNSDTNLIILHKTKDEYQGKNKTGRLERRGYNDTGFLVQCEVWLSKVVPGDHRYPVTQEIANALPGAADGQKHFIGTITKCRHNTYVEGVKLLDPTFKDIAQTVFMTMAEAPEWAMDPSTWD